MAVIRFAGRERVPGVPGYISSVGALAIALLSLPQAAAAQSQPAPAEGVQPPASAAPAETIVTAQRRQELSRDVPITVTSASQLEAANVQSLVSLPKLAPVPASELMWTAFIWPMPWRSISIS